MTYILSVSKLQLLTKVYPILHSDVYPVQASEKEKREKSPFVALALWLAEAGRSWKHHMLAYKRLKDEI